MCLCHGPSVACVIKWHARRANVFNVQNSIVIEQFKHAKLCKSEAFKDETCVNMFKYNASVKVFNMI